MEKVMEKAIEQDKFNASVQALSQRVASLKQSILTEEATKTSLVMPFFRILGYDVFNPLEFTPEFIADVGIKKGEKVDYAILDDKNNPQVLIEVKSITDKLTNHDSQLFRYFSTTTAKISVLTNGNQYRFYTDLDEPNKMDKTPFFTFTLTDLKDGQLAEIFKFHKENFDVESIAKAASDLKYLNYIKEFLLFQLNEPSQDFVKFVINEVYEGAKTKTVIDKFTPVIKKGFRQLIAEQVSNKLNAALKSSVTTTNEEELEEETSENDGIVTTQEELEAYTVVKLALKGHIDMERIFYRDNKSYFNIIIDDNIRKWILRLYINNARKFIVINDENRSELEIKDVTEIYSYKDKLIAVVEQITAK